MTIPCFTAPTSPSSATACSATLRSAPMGSGISPTASGAGGLPVDIAWGSRTSANITPDVDTGIGKWTDEQIIAALSHGVDKDGAVLSPIMPWPYWQSMKSEDLKAIVAWLRTLKPVANVVAR